MVGRGVEEGDYCPQIYDRNGIIPVAVVEYFQRHRKIERILRQQQLHGFAKGHAFDVYEEVDGVVACRPFARRQETAALQTTMMPWPLAG